MRWLMAMLVETAILGAAVQVEAVAQLAREAPGAAFERAAARGRVTLGTIEGFAGTPLSPVTIEAPRVTTRGELAGSVARGEVRAAALLHRVNPGMSEGGGTWLLGVEVAAGCLSDLVPTLRGGALDELELGPTALVVATGDLRADQEDLSPEALRFYRELFGTARIHLDLGLGLNLVSSIRARPGSLAERALRLLGITAPRLVLQGSVLRGASFGELKEARKEKRLAERIKESMALRAYLPEFSLAGLPEGFESGQASVLVTGEPAIGAGFRLTVREGEARRDFECMCKFERKELGTTGLTILGTSSGRWERAFGIPGFDLTEARLLLSIDPGQKLSFGLRAGMELGRKRVALAGKLSFNTVTGAPIGDFFEGTLDSIGVEDLVALCNRIARARGHAGRGLACAAIPAFTLRDLHLKIAPFEGDTDLGVSRGYALAGELHAFGRKVAHVKGAIDLDSIVPSLALEGQAEDFDLGALALKDALVDVFLGLGTDPHFRVKGQLKLIALTRSVDVDLNRRRFCFDTWEELAGVYRTAYHVSSPSRDRPSWDLKASFRNDLTRTLETKVSRLAEKWAREVKQDHGAARSRLDAALGALSVLDGKIEGARAKVRRERAERDRALAEAERRLESIDQSVAKRRAEVQAKRERAADRLARAQRGCDAARKAWERAQRALAEAPLHKKPGLKVIEAAKRAAYKTARGAYLTAKAAHDALMKLPVDADPAIASQLASRAVALKTLEGLRKLRSAIPVDADPRVAGLLASRASAEGTLRAAKLAVGVSEAALSKAASVSAWLARNSGKLLVVDSVSLEGELGSYLAGKRVTLSCRHRLMGKPRSDTLRIRAADFASGRLFEELWERVREKI